MRRKNRVSLEWLGGRELQVEVEEMEGGREDGRGKLREGGKGIRKVRD